MKLLINLSNLHEGGAKYLALSFIQELNLLNNSHNFYIVAPSELYQELKKIKLKNNLILYNTTFTKNSILNILKTRYFLKKIEKRIQQDLSFTLFGPSYWISKYTHVVGFASAWVLEPNNLAYTQLNIYQRKKKRLQSSLKTYFLKKEANYYVTQTNDSKEKLSKVFKIEIKKIYVVGNTYDFIFETPTLKDELLLDKKETLEIRLVTICKYYFHKNLEVIPKVLTHLNKGETVYKFYITIDWNIYNNTFDKSERNIINLGPISIEKSKQLYCESDMLFLPTLLETFTSSYPEAMKMEKPILTSNLSFAHSLCKDSAIYFDPLNPEDIAEKIIELSTDKNLQKNLIEKGKERLKSFETAKSRAEKYLNICETIIKKENK